MTRQEQDNTGGKEGIEKETAEVYTAIELYPSKTSEVWSCPFLTTLRKRP